MKDMESEGYAVVVAVGAPTVPPPRVAPILIPGSLIPVQLAPPLRRAVAWLVDVVPFVLLGIGAVVLVQGTKVWHGIEHGLVTKDFDTKALGLPSVSLTQPPTGAQLLQLAALAGAVLLVFAGWVAYRVLLVSLTGQTAGKWLMGIAVVDAADPSRNPSLRQAFTRWLVPQGAGLVPLPMTGLAPYLWVLKDPKNQGGHDLAAKTLVVRRRR
ncbi:hypothetical protein acdb102_06200 [Acidothermaceae bacterium B102]|nr:hypothetical protein acdb102_06200 [Acidothermaceae bacterium B102]